MPIDLAKVLSFSVEERIRIAQSIWDSVAMALDWCESERSCGSMNTKIVQCRADPLDDQPSDHEAGAKKYH